MPATKRLLFIGGAAKDDALATRREAQLWRACVQLCDVERSGAGEPIGADIIVLTDLAQFDRVQSVKNGARLVAAPLRWTDEWREKIASARPVDALALWDTDAGGAEAVVLAEPFPFASVAPTGQAERRLGILIEPPFAAGELASLSEFAAAVSERSEVWALVVPSLAYFAMAQRHPTAALIGGGALENVVAGSSVCAVAAASAAVDALVGVARASGRRVVRVEQRNPAAAASALTGSDDDVAEPTSVPNAMERIAATLGVHAADDAEIGARIARNLDVSVTVAAVRYNPWLRLFVMEIDVGGDVRREDVTGRIESDGEGELVNAWVARLPESAGAPVRLRAIATLRGALEAKDVRVVVSVWGHAVAIVRAPEPVTEQRAGVIALNLRDSGHAIAEYWGDPGDVKIQLGRKLIEDEPVRRSPGEPSYFRVEGGWPFDRESFTALTEKGVGQKFTNFRNLAFAARPSSARVQAMKNRHEGATAWIIGNGPSARPEDLDRLEGRIAFAFNRFYLAHDRTRLRPTYTVSADRQMIEDFGEEIVARSAGEVFLAHHEAPALSGDYCWLRQVGIFPSLFSRDASQWVSPGGSSLYVALQLGFHMGIRHFFLYGTDFQFHFEPNPDSRDDFRSAKGDGNHFIPNYRDGRDWCPPAIENILPSFLAARLLMESEGGFIRNATRGGVLEVFERIAFDDALAQS